MRIPKENYLPNIPEKVLREVKTSLAWVFGGAAMLGFGIMCVDFFGSILFGGPSTIMVGFAVAALAVSFFCAFAGFFAMLYSFLRFI